MKAALFLLLFGAPDEVDELTALQAVVQKAVSRVEPSVVTITTRGGVRPADIPDEMQTPDEGPYRPRDPRERPPPEGEPEEGATPRFRNEWEKMLAMPGFQKAEGPTTGIVVSADGHIVTSAWNFESRPNVIVVTFHDGTTRAAKLLGIDRAAGLALLRVEASGLTVPEFRDPAGVEVGAWAFAVGRAIARECEVKYGIISAKNRIQGTALQTDAAVSPTNYGGPLIDIDGRVYGILVPLGAGGEETNPNWYDSGIGFAAPIPDPARLVARLGEEGVVLEPAFLGVELDEDRAAEGAAVSRVMPDFPADKAGVQAGDVIVAVDGEPVRNAFSLRFALGRRRAGDAVTLSVVRGEERLELSAKLSARPAGPEDPGKMPVPMPGAPQPKEE